MTFDAVHAEEEILDFVAERRVAGLDVGSREICEEFLISKNVEVPPEVALLVYKGMSALVREKRASDRLYLKTLEYDPDYFRKLVASREEKDPGREARLESARKRREEKYEETWRPIREMGERAMKQLKAMSEFYELWHMPDGTPIGDASREKLLVEAAREQAAADGHLKNAAFYGALAGELKPGQTVRDGIPLDRAHSIRAHIFVQADATRAAA
jgi:hypothetical protein